MKSGANKADSIHIKGAQKHLFQVIIVQVDKFNLKMKRT